MEGGENEESIEGRKGGKEGEREIKRLKEVTDLKKDKILHEKVGRRVDEKEQERKDLKE